MTNADADRNGRVRPAKRLASLKDVARAAGVHPATASRALDPEKMALVRPEKRARVEAAARALGYQADAVARSLRRGRTTTVGVVVADLGNFFLPPILRSIALTLEQSGFMPLIAETQDSQARLRKSLENFMSRKVDAIIVTGARLSDGRILEDAARGGLPIVLAVRPLHDSPFPSVTTDDLAGGRAAAHHFADLGHRRVSELPGPTDVQPFIDRSVGFAQTLRERGGELVGRSQCAEYPIVSEGKRLMDELLSRGDDHPTAVFAHNDAMAIGAIDVLRARGLRCPQDISILGYNDSPLVDHFNPPLSTVRLPSAEIGRFAAELAVALVRDPETMPASMTLQPTLVARGSTARARARRRLSRVQ